MIMKQGPGGHQPLHKIDFRSPELCWPLKFPHQHFVRHMNRMNRMALLFQAPHSSRHLKLAHSIASLIMFDHLLAEHVATGRLFKHRPRSTSNALATGAATGWLERYQWLGTRGHGWIGEASEQKYWKSEVLVGGLERGWIMTFHILGIIIPIDEYFSEGLRPPTSKGVLQILFVVPDHLDLISRYSIYSWIPAIVEPVQKYHIFKFSLWASSALIWKRFLTAISGFSSRGCSCQDVIPFPMMEYAASSPKSILWGWKCFLLNDWIHLSMSYWYPNCCLPLLHTPRTIFEVFFGLLYIPGTVQYAFQKRGYFHGSIQSAWLWSWYLLGTFPHLSVYRIHCSWWFHYKNAHELHSSIAYHLQCICLSQEEAV